MNSNTPTTWNHRFQGGWQSVGGNVQSLSFAIHGAILALRAGLNEIYGWTYDKKTEEITTPKLSIHEYGCALGDGTAVLRALFPTAEIVGFDYASEAIQTARERWPTINFEIGDITDPQADADIIWTSHTLEHVDDPAATIDRLLDRCEVLVVIVPPIHDDDPSGDEHADAEPLDLWLPRTPNRSAEGQFTTLRIDPDTGDGLLESSTLLIWNGGGESRLTRG